MTPDDRPARGHARLLGLLLLLGVFAAGTAFGLGLSRWTRPPHPPRAADRLTRALDLDPQQRAKLLELESQRRPALEALLRASEPEIRAIRDAVEHDLKPFLRPEQVQRLDEIQAQRPPPGHDPFGPPPPGG